MSDIIAVDFETFYSKKLKYSVKLLIAEQYCRHHLFDCYMMSATDGITTWSGHPKDFNWEALDGKIYCIREVNQYNVRGEVVQVIGYNNPWGYEIRHFRLVSRKENCE